jgi:hypothetical protein
MWTLKQLRENGGTPKALLDVFGASKTGPMLDLASKILAKRQAVYYFNKENGIIDDISDLDPGAEEEGKGGWGGLSEFSGRASAAVARAIANTTKEPGK